MRGTGLCTDSLRILEYSLVQTASISSLKKKYNGKTAISGESFSHEKEHEMTETFKRSDSVLLDARSVHGRTCWTLLDRTLELDVDNFLEKKTT